jgi:hypothetical protein
MKMYVFNSKPLHQVCQSYTLPSPPFVPERRSEAKHGQRYSKQKWRSNMADHNKEIDSKFYIFLPRLVTPNPVSDIEKGPRYSCFVGELLNFFLIAQFRGKKRSKSENTKLHEWQERLLGLSTSVSVSCVDLAIHKEYDVHATSGFISCSPTTSSRNENDVNNEISEVRERAIIFFGAHA